MRQHVIVTKYNPAWSHMFENEAKIIKEILGENCIAIHHIGSTSIVGLDAKPIIDIMPVVESLDAVDAVASEFEKIGYVYMGEYGITGRRYLYKGANEHTHHIHIFSKNDNENITRHLAFRDYLNKHDDVKEAYANLKKELAKKYPNDIEGYCDGKDAFVKKYQAEALKYQNQ